MEGARDFPNPIMVLNRSMKKAITLYWTLPVKWAEFISLPSDANTAAKHSKTIWYQQQLITRYAKQNKIDLIDEVVFLEVEPDRGSGLIREPLLKIFKRCRACNAMFIYTDFRGRYGTRVHNALRKLINKEGQGLECLPVDTDTIRTEDGEFDIYGHFKSWKDIQEKQTRDKKQRQKRARAVCKNLTNKNYTHAEIAQILNENGIHTATGKLWAADNVRKFIKSFDVKT
jgi:hypothetical protein